MEKELLFADKLEELRETAKLQGNLITKEQTEEAFAQFHLDEEQMEMVYDYFRQHKIGVGTPVDAEDYLTPEEKSYLHLYLEELAALPVMTDGEKEAVTMSAMAGDRAAQEKLINHYLPQVADIARLYTGQGVLLEDLVGEGNMAVTIGVTMLDAMEKPSEADGMMGKLIMDAMEDFIEKNTDTVSLEEQEEKS